MKVHWSTNLTHIYETVQMLCTTIVYFDSEMAQALVTLSCPFLSKASGSNFLSSAMDITVCFLLS